MKEKLQQLLQKSYSPYSHFRVSAIAVMKDGAEFSGVNVENASYGATICAERNAITTAITYGYGKHDFESLYAMVDSEKISNCCFLCRQVLIEFMEKDKKVTVMNNIGDKKEFTVRELCPEPFDEEDLL